MKTMVPSVLTFLLLTATAVVSQESEKLPKADLRGTIKTLKREVSLGAIGSFQANGVKEVDTKFEKGTVFVGKSTKFFFWKDGKQVLAKFEDLKVGSKVQVTFGSDVTEKDSTAYGPAVRVLILETPKSK